MAQTAPAGDGAALPIVAFVLDSCYDKVSLRKVLYHANSSSRIDILVCSSARFGHGKGGNASKQVCPETSGRWSTLRPERSSGIPTKGIEAVGCETMLSTGPE